MTRLPLSVVAVMTAASMAVADCPPVTVDDPMGVPQGKYAQQYELSEFETLANCKLSFSENPEIAALNSRIRGNPELPPLSERLPEEPLVMAPYHSIGKYGGTFNGMSNATEAGTHDFVTLRHVNLVRLADDLVTIVPNIAKDYEWNDDFTQLTFFLRKGHRWSDGAPFTADDVKFWYDNLALDSKVIPNPTDYTLVAGERMTVDVIDPQTVRFNLPAPKPGLLVHFATSWAQGFQPKHFLGRYHPDINPDADKLAQEAGFENGLAVIKAYWGNTDWTDSPSALLSAPDRVANLPADVVPTLESHIYISDTVEGRHLVANPYFHIVDTAGNQLPYINEQDETYIPNTEVRILRLINGEADYKQQGVTLPNAPLLLENQEAGGYQIDLAPSPFLVAVGFNVTSDDLEKRKVFGDLRFRQAMSIAIDRDEINETAYFGLGEPSQYTGISPLPDFIDQKWKSHYVEYDPDRAAALLDEVGMVDTDGDGFRDLPNGDTFVLNLQFSSQEMPAQVIELISLNWSEVGVNTTIKEIATDEYRSAQSAGLLDVVVWVKGRMLLGHLGTNDYWVPPFADYFNLRVGLKWAEWIQTDGASGVEPPDYVYELIKDIDTFQSVAIGSEEFEAAANRLVENMVSNMLFIGTVFAPGPIYHRNALKNFKTFSVAGSPAANYPWRANQWYLDEGN
ncbi:MAG: ABC transporter substrate-binding protein [Paracoccaceae bacterium]|nr:ABC transporter substrate-binding protein [Paracoccaceae bacterium]